MKVQYCSDLHLEFEMNQLFLKAHPLQVAGDVLLLAGDIVPFTRMDRYADFFSWASDNYQATYWIPGNHEYYGSDISTYREPFCKKIRENVFLLNNTSVVIGGLTFVFSTLWSFISPARAETIEASTADFHRIRNGSRILNYSDFNQLHEASIQFLRKTLSEDNGTAANIILTHHVPTLMHYPEQYRNSRLTDAFAVELQPFIAGTHADYWIYGHHHVNVPAFTIGTTTLLTNQLGYVARNEQAGFRTDALVYL